jgi:hypothetical protein
MKFVIEERGVVAMVDENDYRGARVQSLLPMKLFALRVQRHARGGADANFEEVW